MTSGSVDPATVLAHYEALRRTALDAAPATTTGVGMVLLRSRGLPAWLAALTALGPAPVPPPVVAAAGASLAAGGRAALTTLVADMVLACQAEASA